MGHGWEATVRNQASGNGHVTPNHSLCLLAETRERARGTYVTSLRVNVQCPENRGTTRSLDFKRIEHPGAANSSTWSRMCVRCMLYMWCMWRMWRIWAYMKYVKNVKVTCVVLVAYVTRMWRVWRICRYFGHLCLVRSVCLHLDGVRLVRERDCA